MATEVRREEGNEEEGETERVVTGAPSLPLRIESRREARGEDGKIKRENAQKLSVKFSEMWDEENGSGWKDLKKLVEGL